MSLKTPIRGIIPAEVWGYVDRRLTRAPMLKRVCWSGADGDASFVPTTATTYTFPRPIMFYRNLVIGSYATLRTPPGYRVQILCVSDTLRLDGVIDVSGVGGAGGRGGGDGPGRGGGRGGNGGGGIIVIARGIVGSGRILANGLNGSDGSPTWVGGDGGHGASGAFKSISIPGGSGGSGSAGGGGGAGVWGNGGRGAGTGAGAGGVNPKDPRFFDISADLIFDGFAGGGGGGGNDGSAVLAGGGGGGGGGLIIIMSESPIPGITLEAVGGRGGAGGLGGAGGGGGGGLIIVVAPGDNSVKNVAGGASGGAGASAGELGLTLFIPASVYEVI